jgi:hypothetical protein
MAAAAITLLPGNLPAQTDKAAAPAASGASGTGKVPDYAKDMLHSDMDGIGPDGKPTGQKATFTAASKANAEAKKAMQHKMKLTQSYWTKRLPDRGGDPNGTAEFYFSDPDGIYIQLQDARYCGGSGYLGDKCGTPENPTGRGRHHGH